MGQGRVLPINRGGYTPGDPIPRAALQSITMGVRIGDTTKAIGYIQEFNWNMDRDNKVLHQIEPFPNGTFGGGSFTAEFTDSNNVYWPGEPIEIVPGKVGGVTVTLKRYSLYSSNLLASVFRAAEKAHQNDDRYKAGNIQEDIPEDYVNLNGQVPNNYVSLIQQVRPVEIYQIFYSPYNGAEIFGRRFEECWFTKIGETIPTAEENGPILEDGELIATRIRAYNSVG